MTDTLFPRPIAHRGLHDKAAGIIENSASAFEAAIAGDFAIECDVQLTRDSVPVVFHDDAMERLIGLPGPIADASADQVTGTALLGSAAGDKPQRFTNFLAQISGRTLLQIELKQQRDATSTQLLARSVAESLADYAGPVTIESFDPALLTAIRECGFGGPRGIITYAYPDDDETSQLNDEQRYTLRHLLHWHETQFDFISCHHLALELPAIKFWRALGKPVTAWTIRSKVEAAAARPHMDQIVFEGFNPDIAR
ncbi:glycerophosphodiester phosphodiesterase [Devosia sp. BSSL-BM10]|uniref:Glycerophosphodiester phosphodiesterase n=1 Tax=Devosia litorisediminis TaxID=2829817 RepID=A0A942I624_9HYPH|nr:glycerophosphodiester phosphodiesterase family protein [Devosia litorisediminis]MBS3848363.1 glycerophosphodiester phosphodiesterase [Devosia litorisediminis]